MTFVDQIALGHVRYGSEADISSADLSVRFVPLG